MARQYTEFEVEEMNFKSEDADTVSETGCIGTAEETLNIRTIKKKCKGRVVKQKSLHDGSGELKVTGHMYYDAYCKMYGMDNAEFLDGVKTYGKGTVPNLLIMQKIRDEDGVLKLKAYPDAVVSSASARKIDSTVDEIAEVEITYSLSCDEKGQAMYEMIIEDEESATNKALITSWMSGFTPELVAKKG